MNVAKKEDRNLCSRYHDIEKETSMKNFYFKPSLRLTVLGSIKDFFAFVCMSVKTATTV